MYFGIMRYFCIENKIYPKYHEKKSDSYGSPAADHNHDYQLWQRQTRH